mmetsp:Transcript_13646/g.57366  ORF Transcript_13646/g.57366 Transcript_13646/m.57366 type:complete len:233 (-) Transcript_13646:3702-4400(-)
MSSSESPESPARSETPPPRTLILCVSFPAARSSASTSASSPSHAGQNQSPSGTARSGGAQHHVWHPASHASQSRMRSSQSPPPHISHSAFSMRSSASASNAAVSSSCKTDICFGATTRRRSVPSLGDCQTTAWKRALQRGHALQTLDHRSTQSKQKTCLAVEAHPSAAPSSSPRSTAGTRGTSRQMAHVTGSISSFPRSSPSSTFLPSSSVLSKRRSCLSRRMSFTRSRRRR